MPTVVHNPKAVEDIRNHALYLVDEASEETAIRFLDAIDQTLSELSTMPLMGRFLDLENEELMHIHVWRVNGFKNWLIFYRPIENGIELVRLLHGAQDIQGLFKIKDWG